MALEDFPIDEFSFIFARSLLWAAVGGTAVWGESKREFPSGKYFFALQSLPIGLKSIIRCLQVSGSEGKKAF
jgi:hypothetical protein